MTYLDLTMLTIERGGLRRLERGITPPLGKTITIPVRVKDGGSLVVYVATSAFDLAQPSDEVVACLAELIVQGLTPEAPPARSLHNNPTIQAQERADKERGK